MFTKARQRFPGGSWPTIVAALGWREARRRDIVGGMVGPENVTASVQLWRSADQGSRVAIYDSRTRALFITTQQFINLTNAKNRQITPRANRPLFGSSGLPQKNMQPFDKSTAGLLRQAQSKPSATPAK